MFVEFMARCLRESRNGIPAHRCALGLFCNAAIVVIFLVSASAACGANVLLWNTNQNRVTADIRNGDLAEMLGRISGYTGWSVLVEPDAQHRISTKFRNLPPGQALGRLLGSLSFAMLPGKSNAPPRLLVFATTSGSATQVVRAIAPEVKKAATNLIANELIVRLKPGTDVNALARQVGAKVKGRLAGQDTYRLEFENADDAEAARATLADNSQVAAIDGNYSLKRPTDPDGVAAGNLPPRPNLTMKDPPENGRVIVALIDTAVQSLGPDLDPFVMKQLSVAGPSQVDPSQPSHGTTMAETLLRSLQIGTEGNTSVQILPVDVYGPNPSSSTFDVANGIVQAVNSGARIVNLSLGSEAGSPMLQQVIREASSKGVLFFAAAGNTPVTTPFYPAAYPEVMAVTAADHGQIADYANRGSFVSLAAPGTSIIYYNGQPYYVVGTSASSAFTSGAAAAFMEQTQGDASKTRSYVTSVFGVGEPAQGGGTSTGTPPTRRSQRR